MRRHKIAALVLIVGLVAAVPAFAGSAAVSAQNPTECEYPFTVEDATGTEVTLDEPPDDIVVMHPSGAQIAQDIGAWDRVAGAPVDPFTAYLDDHDAPHDVTGDDGPVREEIVNLSPDIVLASHLGDWETVETLRDDGLTVYIGPQPTSVDDISQKVDRYGQLMGACTGAAETTDWMDERMDAVDERTEDVDSPLVYYEMGGGWTTGAETFQSDMIERAGGENLGDQAGVVGWGEVDAETVVDMDPEWILYGDSTAEPPIADSMTATTAYMNNQTVRTDANYMSQAGPRVVIAIEEMANAFAAATDTNGDDGTEAENGDDRDDTGDDDPPSDADDEPEETNALIGFGAIAGITAIVIVTINRVRP